MPITLSILLAYKSDFSRCCIKKSDFFIHPLYDTPDFFSPFATTT